MNRNAQIQMMETIAILIIFFVLIIISFVFFMKTSSLGQEQKITKNQELESIRVSQAISFLPELQCSSKNILKDNCFDKYKLNAFQNLPNKNKTYYPLFYFSDISVKEIYPFSGSKWSLYNLSIDGTSYMTSIPILLYNATSRTNSFGILNIKYYARG